MSKSNLARYDSTTRTYVRRRIGKMVREGKSFDDIAAALNEEGIKTPSGGAVDSKFVYNQFYMLNMNRSRKLKVSNPQPTKRKSDDLVTTILNHPRLTQSQKIEIMKIVTQNG